ncbi:hypothetical protein BJ742DRAFT_870568 [Cladochytrium replicatum]|nr:hypothetical protein BJ742DRAFT_870568 [Cladochytrium replicatum]
MEVEGDVYIHALASFIRNNESTLLPKSSDPANTDTSPPVDSAALSQQNPQLASFDVFGIGAAFGNLIPKQPSASSLSKNSAPVDPLSADGASLQPFSFVLDPYQLAYLLDCFDSSPLVDEFVRTGSLPTAIIPAAQDNIDSSTIPAAGPSGKAQPNAPPPPNAFVSMFSMWGQQPQSHVSSSSAAPPPTLDENLVYMYHFFSRLRTLKLAPVGQKRIGGVAYGGDAIVSLAPFQSVESVELYKIFPATVKDWDMITDQLTTFSCQNTLNSLDELVDSMKGIAQSKVALLLRQTRQEQQKVHLPTLRAVSSEEELTSSVSSDQSTRPSFPKLCRIDLSHNSLSDVPASLTIHFPSCTEMDMSHNMFECIPNSLSALTQLHSLDLSHNRIDTLAPPDVANSTLAYGSLAGHTPLSHVLRNITTLNLQKNLLENLVGVERLPSLKRIDIRDNKIADVFEVGRLASLLNLEDIKVSGNPLTKQPNYRSNVFTYFKSRALTLFLDGTVPTSAEKKLIRANLTVTPEAAKSRTVSPGEEDVEDSDKHSVGVLSHTSDDRTTVPAQTDRVVVKGKKVNSKPKITNEGESLKKSTSRTLNKSASKELSSLTGTLETTPSTDGIAATEPDTTPRRLRLADVETSVRATEISVTFPTDQEDDDSLEVDSSDLLLSRKGTRGTKIKVIRSEKEKQTANQNDQHLPLSTVLTEAALNDVDETRTETEAQTVTEEVPWSKLYADLQEKARARKAAADAATASSFQQDLALADRADALQAEVQQRIGVALAKIRDVSPDTRKDSAGISLRGSLSKSQPKMERSASTGSITLNTRDEPPPSPKASVSASQPVKSGKLPMSPTILGSSVGHIPSIGPYRRVYDFGTQAKSQPSEGGDNHPGYRKPMGFGKPRGDGSPTFAEVGTSKRIPTTAPDVEVGTSDDFRALNLGKATSKVNGSLSLVGNDVPGMSNSKGSLNVRPLPPLAITPQAQQQQGAQVIQMLGNIIGQISGTPQQFHGHQGHAHSQQQAGIHVQHQPFPDGARSLGNVKSPGSVTSGGTSTSGGYRGHAPALVLSRPITFNMSYTSRGASSSGTGNSIAGDVRYASSTSSRSSSRSVTVFSSGYTRSNYGGTNYARSVAGGNMFGGSVFGAPAGATEGTGDGSQMALLPRAPSIPFMTMTNSLQLYLKFQVFNSDSERILCWVPGSYVAQLPPYVTEAHGGATAWSRWTSSSGGGGSGAFSWFTKNFGPKNEQSGSPRDRRASNSGASTGGIAPQLSAAEIMDRVLPVERPAFFLLTDQNFYIFTPNFPFPYFSRDALDPYAQYVHSAMQQVRYDDPARYLSLLYQVPFAALARLDVGPNKQYLAVHFLRSKAFRGSSGISLAPRAGLEESPQKPQSDNASNDSESLVKNPASASSSNANTPRNSNTAQSPPSFRNFGNWYTGQHTQTPFVSLVLFMRDKTITSRFLEQLVAGMPALQPKVINEDSTWVAKSIRENLVLKSGEKDIVYKSISTDWKNLDVTAGSLSGQIPTAGDESVAAKSADESQKVPIVSELDEDPAAASPTDDFVKLYLLAGWVIPASPSARNTSGLEAVASSLSQLLGGQKQPQQQIPMETGQYLPLPSQGVPPAIKTCTLVASTDFIYLTPERFDVWPPLLFPQDTEALAPPNATIEDAAASALLQLKRDSKGSTSSSAGTGVGATSALSNAYKGLVADLVLPFSNPPLAVVPIKEIRRCERWRSWRYTAKKQVKQIGGDSGEYGVMIMNGLIGASPTVRGLRGRSTSREELSSTAAGSPPSVPSSPVTPSISLSPSQSSDLPSAHQEESKNRVMTPSRTGRSSSISASASPPNFGGLGALFRRGSGGASPDSGNAAGWGWWVRMFCSKDIEGAEPIEYWFDFMFSTMGSSNEFLAYIRDVRGVNLEDGEDGNEASGFDELAAVEDGREHELEGDLLSKRRKDGVVFVIGDD